MNLSEHTMKNIKASGIYQIRNIVNNHVYIGSAIQLNTRWSNHKAMLTCNKHTNPYLQAAYNKYGSSSFIFEILLNCSKEELLNQEQKYLDTYWDNCKTCYNILKLAYSRLGEKTSDETKQKISISRTGKKASEATKQKLSLIQSGINNGHYGKLHSEATKLVMSNLKAGIPLTEQHKINIGLSLSGRNPSKEERVAHSKSRQTLTNEQILEIKRHNKSYNELAKEYGVSKSCIQRIIKNRTFIFIMEN